MARAPNHLGDGVMALPALQALSRVSDLVIAAPRWGGDLYRDLDANVVAADAPLDGDVAVLFPPSLRAAWQARRCRRRIGVRGDALRAWVLTDRVHELRHRRDTYAALVRVAGGGEVVDAPHYGRRTTDPVAEVPDGHIGMNPISVSGAVVEWAGFAALAKRVSRPVVWYAGPGEGDLLRAVAGGGATLRVGLALPAMASALSRCGAFVSNDSGMAHFARACGAPTVVVHGSTTASRTGPAGAVAVEGPSLPCRPCYRKSCRVGVGCLDVSVDAVLHALSGCLGGGG